MLMCLIILFLISTTAVSTEASALPIRNTPYTTTSDPTKTTSYLSTTATTDPFVDSCAVNRFAASKTVLHCSGIPLKKYHNQIKPSTEKDFDIKGVFNQLIDRYKNNITEVVLYNLKILPHLESSTFKNLKALKVLTISLTQSLKELPVDIFRGLSKSFNVLKIRKTNLKAIPDLSDLGVPTEMHTIEFEGNTFDVLPTNGIKTRAAQLLLENNHIRVVEDWAFSGSEIGELSLKGNSLDILSDHSFDGIINLRKIDLSDSLLKVLPILGLKNIEAIYLENAPLLTAIPSIHTLAYLKKAHLTYSFHCCSFQFPTKQDISTYEFHQEDFDYTLTKDCVQIKENNVSLNFVSQDFINGSEEESFFNGPVQTVGVHNFKCGKITPAIAISYVQCTPEPDDLNPCENIMGRYWLRIAVWIVGIGALCLNIIVLLVVLRKRFNFSVPRFLMSNLAFADLCTAIYLLLLAYEDFVSKENYFNYAFTWQNGIGCKIGGFLTVFSSQLSVYALCMLTFERWYSIRKALYTTKLTYTTTVKIMAVGWIYSITMATMPLLGISSYTTTSICLPMDTAHLSGTCYILVLLMFAGGAFLLMLFCYIQMYTSLSYETRHAVKGEASVARKIFVLVGTNFACTVPVIFFGLTALLGYPLIDVPKSKILLVLIYPINSCANPLLYTILTAGFRREIVTIFNKFGLVLKTEREYKVIYTTQTQRINTQQIPKAITSPTMQQP